MTIIITALISLIGMISIIGFIILSVVYMAYKSQSPGKGYISEIEQIFFLIFGTFIGSFLVFMTFGSTVLSISLALLFILATSIVVFGKS